MSTAFDAHRHRHRPGRSSLAARLTAAGMKVAIIERKLFGGTCVNTGCIPTKAMVASAYAAHHGAPRGGFRRDDRRPVSVDMKRVKARKDADFRPVATGVESWLKKHGRTARCIEGHARFESPHEVSVGEVRLTAERIFINVGGRAAIPDMPGLDQIAYLTNSSMMERRFASPCI